MQRLNKSTHAPIGTAIFLLLGLAILPVSLRVAGAPISFSPRLAAAMDAWRQIVEVLGASSQPGIDSALALVNDVDTNSLSPIEASVRPPGEFACARAAADSAARSSALQDPCALKETPVRRSSRKVALPEPLFPKVVAPLVVAGFERRTRTIGVLGSNKLETLTREKLFKAFEKQSSPAFEAIAQIRNLPIPIAKNLRVIIRTKRAVASSAKATERKAFSALDSSRRRECDRAMLTGAALGIPDNSEF